MALSPGGLEFDGAEQRIVERIDDAIDDIAGEDEISEAMGLVNPPIRLVN